MVRNIFLIGVVIAIALAIVVGLVLCVPWRPSRPKIVEHPVGTAPIQRAFTNSVGMSFMLIPAGSFTMGSPTGEPKRDDGERQHPVTISKPFYLQTTEATQKQWTQVMGSNPSSFKACGDDCPVETVSWNDVQEFIRKLNQTESVTKYRLPTEAEWEYACRAGSRGRFCFGDEEAKLGEYAWYAGRTTHPVGQKKPNAWGLYDMHGNVWEWCQDWYGDYTTSQVRDPTGPEIGESRMLRGGSFLFIARNLRSANRNWRGPDSGNFNIGFRVARDP
jgi:formylglycine-generating enzyme required for sulfatase activity